MATKGKGSADDPVKGAGPRLANGKLPHPKARVQGQGALPHAGLKSEWAARPEAELVGAEGAFGAKALWNETTKGAEGRSFVRQDSPIERASGGKDG